MTKRRYHQAWLMLAVCCSLMANIATITTCLSLLTKPVSEALSFTRAAFTTYITIMSLMNACGMPIWGKIMPAIGIKKTLLISAVTGSVGFMLMAHFTSLIQFYIAAAFIGFSVPGRTYIPTSIIINNWFAAKKGLAFGIATAFTGVGGAVLSPLVVEVIYNYGWQTAYTFLGITVLILSAPAIFMAKTSPGEAGLEAYGANAETAAAQNEPALLAGVSSGIAFKSTAFVIIILVIILVNIGITGIIQHIPPHLINIGIDPTRVGFLLSLAMIAMIISKISLGVVNDRTGTLTAANISILGGMAGLLLLVFSRGQALIILGLAMVELGISFCIVFPPLFTAKLFGAKDFAVIYSVIQGFSTLGYGLGSPFYGMFFDRTGSYNLAIYTGIIMSAAALILIPLSFKASKKLIKQKE